MSLGAMFINRVILLCRFSGGGGVANTEVLMYVLSNC